MANLLNKAKVKIEVFSAEHPVRLALTVFVIALAIVIALSFTSYSLALPLTAP
jgi:hypothetical protein